MAVRINNGIVEKLSKHSVDETVAKLRQLLDAKGLTLFALVDHGGEAEKVGLAMPPTRLLIFGNPKAGTPLMLAAPSTALDLPLKILVRQEGDAVLISYNSPADLQERHGFPKELIANISAIEALATAAAE